jgi:secondary thiamine-phosphate synthase enzyme
MKILFAMIQQQSIRLAARPRGFHLITNEVLEQLPALPTTGLLELFIQHTSAGLTINENADPDVRLDFETIFNRLVPENQSGLLHTLEGPDDMPAHIKASLVGFSVRIPITNSQLNLGIWQGVYLCEFRNHGGSRKLIATIIS